MPYGLHSKICINSYLPESMVCGGFPSRSPGSGVPSRAKAVAATGCLGGRLPLGTGVGASVADADGEGIDITVTLGTCEAPSPGVTMMRPQPGDSNTISETGRALDNLDGDREPPVLPGRDTPAPPRRTACATVTAGCHR
jgi:hypothetical protein